MILSLRGWKDWGLAPDFLGLSLGKRTYVADAPTQNAYLMLLEVMAQSPVLYALKRKRSEIAGVLLDVEKQQRDLSHKLDAVDTCLALFGYKGDPSRIVPKRRYERLFDHKELMRMTRRIIEERGTLITNRDLAIEIIKIKEWDETDPVLPARLAARIKGTAREVRRRVASNP